LPNEHAGKVGCRTADPEVSLDPSAAMALMRSHPGSGGHNEAERRIAAHHDVEDLESRIARPAPDPSFVPGSITTDPALPAMERT
jgi:hypothetical protein